jgi:hypothetical protein
MMGTTKQMSDMSSFRDLEPQIPTMPPIILFMDLTVVYTGNPEFSFNTTMNTHGELL